MDFDVLEQFWCIYINSNREEGFTYPIYTGVVLHIRVIMGKYLMAHSVKISLKSHFIPVIWIMCNYWLSAICICRAGYFCYRRKGQESTVDWNVFESFFGNICNYFHNIERNQGHVSYAMHEQIKAAFLLATFTAFHVFFTFCGA